jgi:hypothetical protein
MRREHNVLDVSSSTTECACVRACLLGTSYDVEAVLRLTTQKPNYEHISVIELLISIASADIPYSSEWCLSCQGPSSVAVLMTIELSD